MSKTIPIAAISTGNVAVRTFKWLIRPLRGRAVTNFGYTVDIDDYPGQVLPNDTTVEQFEELLKELPTYFEGAITSLSRVPDPAPAPDKDAAA
jgi:hypothetical protein